MKIYTSYFANLRRLPANITPISIARKNPPWFKGGQLIELAPELRVIKWSPKQYIPYYNELLSRLDPVDILRKIKKLSMGKDVALLCWEGPGKFCHRHLVADWLIRFCGIRVKEYSAENAVSIKKGGTDKCRLK